MQTAALDVLLVMVFRGCGIKSGCIKKELTGVRRFASKLSGVNGQMLSYCYTGHCPLTPASETSLTPVNS